MAEHNIDPKYMDDSQTYSQRTRRARSDYDAKTAEERIADDVQEHARKKSSNLMKLGGTGLAITVAAASLLSPAHKKNNAAEAEFTPAKAYIVKPYDTPWTIAERADLGGDIRESVDKMMKSMHMGGKQELGDYIQPGETVMLPDNSKIGKESFVSSEYKDDLPLVTAVPAPPDNSGPGAGGIPNP